MPTPLSERTDSPEGPPPLYWPASAHPRPRSLARQTVSFSPNSEARKVHVGQTAHDSQRLVDCQAKIRLTVKFLALWLALSLVPLAALAAAKAWR